VSDSRRLFYSGVGVCYFFAMYSLYTQFPGLVGSQGLSPAESYVKSVRDSKPGMSWFDFSWVFMASELSVTVDAFTEFLMCVGMVSSLLIIAGCRSTLLFALCWVCFRSIRDVFQVYTGFQWDILMLECGFICILSLFCRSGRFLANGNLNQRIDNIFNWCFRVLAFKLMFLAGVVKLQARCPTWDALSALEYHFATQCIPTYLSWYAHQLPPILLRIGVAATLLIEIPYALFLVAPWTRMRRFGCMLQWLLQVMIFLTGNYNYFNILTSVLMLPAWDSDVHKSDTSRLGNIAGVSIAMDLDGPIVALHRLSHAIMSKRIFGVMIVDLITAMITVGVSYFCVNAAFDSSRDWWRGENLTWNVTWGQLSPWLSPTVTVSFVVILFGVFTEWFQGYQASVVFERKAGQMEPTFRVVKTLLSSFCCVIAGFVAVAWIYLSMQHLSAVCDVSAMTISARLLPSQFTDYASRISGVSSYGLFRRMTGVGSVDSKRLKSLQRTWNTTLVPSVVARPEIVIEGYDGATKRWKEIEFR
jgi:hypothetical protein